MKNEKKTPLFEALKAESMEEPLRVLASLNGVDESLSGEELIKALFDMGCSFEEWREQAKMYKSKYANDINGCSVIHSDENESYMGSNSPLESLSYHMSKDFFFVPPAEVLMVIVNQFKWYMENGGAVSLEEAFFGSPAGKGVYAYRELKDTHSYLYFHRKLNLESNVLPQPELVEYLINGPETEGGEYNPLRNYRNQPDFNIESFLKGYRRWRKSHGV